MKSIGYLLLNTCGCCADDPDVGLVGRYIMPDGAELLALETLDEDRRTFWYDPRLNAGDIDA